MNTLPQFPVFSPSSTQKWSFCPVAWLLDQEGWVPRREYTYRLIPRLAGEAFSTAALVHYTTHSRSTPDQLDSVLRQRTDPLEDAGVMVSDSTWEWARGQAVEKALKALDVLERNDPYATMQFEQGEFSFLPQYGNARLDATFRNPETHGLIMVDWKLLSRAPARYAYSHQMHHYAWCAKEVWGELPERVEIAVLNQGGVGTIPVSVTEESVEQWLQTAKQAWAQMDAQRQGARPWMNPSHESKYGPCEFQKACLEDQWDEALMGLDYVKVERK